MKGARVFLGLTLLSVGALLCVLAFRATRLRQESTVVGQAAGTKLDALKQESREIADLAASAEARVAELSIKLTELQKQADVTRSLAPRQTGIINVSQLLEFDPKFREIVDAGMRGRHASTWEPLYRSFGFSEKDRDDFWAIYKEFGERRDDVMQASMKYQMNADSPGIDALLQQEIGDMRKQMSGRFGEAREKAFFEFLRKTESREFADALATRVAFSDPLSTAQADRLTQIVAEATPAYAAGKFADNRNVDWEKVDKEIAAILSAEQFAAWKRQGLSSPATNSTRSREYLQMMAAYERVLKAEKRTGEN